MHATTFPYLYLIPLFPLIGALFNALAGSAGLRKYGEKWVHLPSVILPWLSFVVTAAAFITMMQLPAGARNLHQSLWSWIPVGGMDVDVAFWMDPLSLVMCFVVTFVGSLIHVYAIGYMHKDPGYWRFFAEFNLFMFAMLMLVLGDNFLMMFIGWEGVGLCSYLLISFWYKEKENAVAGMKAFVVNRIGDFAFVLGLFLLFWGLAGDLPSSSRRAVAPLYGEQKLAGTTVQGICPMCAHAECTCHDAEHAAAPAHHEAEAHGHPHGTEAHGHDHGEHAREPVEANPHGTSLAFRKIEHMLEDPAFRENFMGRKVMGISIVTLACILFFIGATGKSAQIPLYVWLPDAMAGPTPVSALIHAATMVTAGVYMVARLHFLFALSPVAMTVVALVGAATALFAATIGLFQYDIKKVLAYSTVSQLGFMFIAVGVGAYWVGIFHLMTHAFFKACLFLGSGSVILGCHHEQDMRHMGGLSKFMPTTAWTYFIACCAIAGFPFFSGFFSKDEILWKAFDSGNTLLPGGGSIVWLLGALGALCTSFYMFRSYYMTFSGSYRGVHSSHGHGDDHGHGGNPKESTPSITIVLAILAILAVVGGYVGLPHLWHLPNYFEHWMEPVFETSHQFIHSAHRAHSAEWTLMILSVIIAFAGFFIARGFYRDDKSQVPKRLKESDNPTISGVYRTIYNKYYVDELYHATVVRLIMIITAVCDWFDRWIVDGAVNLVGAIGRGFGYVAGFTDNEGVDGAVNGVAQTFVYGGSQLRKAQTGRLRSYLLAVMTGTVILVIVNYFLLK
jgi:NADH-quinone oxidoreductase subunit L